MEVAGRGGMGVVLKALDPKLDRVVAIKLMSTSTSPEMRDRFLREARAVAAVVHENVVTIHAADELDETPYIVMQYINGPTLKDLIDEQGPLPTSRILEVAKQMAAGLAAAHRRGLVHRDIKPANILIDNETGQALLSDFGLVKNAEGGNNELTRSGTLLGTPKYMAPEQAKEYSADARSDLFSLGGVLYAMCTGTAPFDGDSTLEVLKQVCDDAPQPIRELNPTIPKDLVAVVDRLQQKKPDDRFQNADDLLAALSTVNISEARRDKPTQPRTMVVAFFLGCVAIAALLIALRGTSTRNGHAFSLKSNGESFATLAEAVEAATDTDTILIEGPGPYETEPLVVAGKSLTIASDDASKVVAGTYSGPMLTIKSSCVLDGVELHQPAIGQMRKIFRGHEIGGWEQSVMIMIEGEGELHVSYCDLRPGEDRIAVSHNGRSLTIDNTLFQCPIGGGVLWHSRDQSTVSISNAEIHSAVGVWARESDSALSLENVTWIGDDAVGAQPQFLRIREAEESHDGRLKVDLKQCLVVGDILVSFRSHLPRTGLNSLSDSFQLTEKENVYAVQTYLQNRRRREKTLSGWRRLIDSSDSTSVAASIEVGDDAIVDRNAIEWSNEDRVSAFGASAKLGPAAR